MRRTAFVAFLGAALVAWLAISRDAGERPGGVERTGAPRDVAPLEEADPRLVGLGREADAPGRTGTVADQRMQPPEGSDDDDVEHYDLRVEVVDALTGVPLAARWNIGTGDIVAAPFAPGQVIDEAAIEASRRGVEESRAAWEARFVDAGRTQELFWDEARPFAVAVTIHEPLRYVPYWPVLNARPSLLPLHASLAHGIREVLARLPLWPEAVLDLEVQGPDGRPADGATVVGVAVGGIRIGGQIEGRGSGRMRVRGVPFLAGETVDLRVEWPAPDAGDEPPIEESPLAEADEVEETGGETLTSPNVRTYVPERLSEEWRVLVRLPGYTKDEILDHVETDNDLAFEEELGEGGDELQAPTGEVLLRLLGWDGEPIAGAPVADGRTDAAGEILLGDQRPGEQTYSVVLPGRFSMTATATVASRRRIEVTLREPLGARLEVQAVDAGGRPVASAYLSVNGTRAFDVEGGVQRVDLFTDHLGRRTFARVAPGRVGIAARRGHQRGQTFVDLRDGESRTVRIVLD